MNITEITLVQTRLNALIKQPLTQVSRETDMLLLHFGSRWTMRIQCYYRLTEQGRTILARNDVYQPSEAMWSLWRSLGYEEDYIPEDFHSDDEGCNRLDEALERLNNDLDGLYSLGYADGACTNPIFPPVHPASSLDISAVIHAIVIR